MHTLSLSRYVIIDPGMSLGMMQNLFRYLATDKKRCLICIFYAPFNLNTPAGRLSKKPLPAYTTQGDPFDGCGHLHIPFYPQPPMENLNDPARSVDPSLHRDGKRRTPGVRYRGVLVMNQLGKEVKLSSWGGPLWEGVKGDKTDGRGQRKKQPN